MSTERRVGTISRGIRCPIFREGDNLAEQVVDSVLAAAESEGFELGQHRVQAKVMVSWCEKTNKQTDKTNLKHKAASCQPLQNCTKVTCCS